MKSLANILIFVIITPLSLYAQIDNSNDLKPFEWDTIRDDSDEISNDGSEEQSSESDNVVDASVEFSYAAFGKTDPFVPPLPSEVTGFVEIKVVSLLQRYSTDQLTLNGIWQVPDPKNKGATQRRALVVSPIKEGVTVSVGDPIGNLGGSIISIESDHIIAREYAVTDDGTRQFRDVALWLGDREPGEPEKIVISTNALKARPTSEATDFITSKKAERLEKAKVYAESENDILELYDSSNKDQRTDSKQQPSVIESVPKLLPPPALPNKD